MRLSRRVFRTGKNIIYRPNLSISQKQPFMPFLRYCSETTGEGDPKGKAPNGGGGRASHDTSTFPPSTVEERRSSVYQFPSSKIVMGGGRVSCAPAAHALISLFNGSDFVKAENDTLTLADGWRRLRAVSAIPKGMTETAEACRFLPSANFVFLTRKKCGAINKALGPAPSPSLPAHRICRSPSSKIRTGGGRASCAPAAHAHPPPARTASARRVRLMAHALI